LNYIIPTTPLSLQTSNVFLMSLPLFFHDGLLNASSEIQLDEETARHVVQVLRMQPGEQLQLTNGKGVSAMTTIVKAEKKKLFVAVNNIEQYPGRANKLHLCVAFTKNTSRNEWLLEKATELGVSSIVPIIATRTDRERIRYDRWRNILVAALIQSQQYHLPELLEALPLKDILQRFNGVEQKLVGHCISTESRSPIAIALQKDKETIVLIGPEGDFTLEEVHACTENGYTGISLVDQRLRTETAAMAVCAYFSLVNH
jgi:16S rRNA (uracil1498-N3)-methyltransferase